MAFLYGIPHINTGGKGVVFAEITGFSKNNEVDNQNLVLAYVDHLRSSKKLQPASKEPQKQESKSAYIKEIVNNQKRGLKMINDSTYLQFKKQKLEVETQTSSFQQIEYLMKMSVQYKGICNLFRR